MNKKQVKAIASRLLPDLPDFVYKDETLFLTPIEHTARCIAFNRSSDPICFYVEICIQPLFVPPESTGFNIGWRLRHNKNEGWSVDDPELISKLRAGIHADAVPFLQSIKTVRDVARATMIMSQTRGPVRPMVGYTVNEHSVDRQTTGYALAYDGDLDSALPFLDYIIQTYDPES